MAPFAGFVVSYQTRQDSPGTWVGPWWQLKALPNSSKFCTEPLARHLPGECGISERGLAGRLLGLILAPDLGEADEVALRLGVAIDLVGDGFACAASVSSNAM